MSKLYALLFSTIFFVTTTVPAWAASKPVTASVQNNLSGQTRIVGGEPALPGAWPWMSALVFTSAGVETQLTVGSTSYQTSAFTGSPNGSPTGSVVGNLVDCGIGDTPCPDAQNRICLIERGDINFSDKALNCEAGSGIGVIIFNNEAGQISGTLGTNFSGSVPVVAVSQQDGQLLLQQLGQSADLTVATVSALQQDSTCGATFLGGKWVLSAAHCVDGSSASRLKVNVGEFDLADGAQNARSIANIYIHGDYNADTINNDIALIELIDSVDAPAVALASEQLTEQLTMEHSLATIIGWGGRTGYAPGEGPTTDFPDELHQVDLQLMTNQECRTVLADSLRIPEQNTGVTSMMLCASAPQGGKGSCQGDSGGPLLVDSNTGPQQVGIVSWGFGCADAGYPGVFTRVSQFKNWIAAISQGIAITQKQDFAANPVGVTQEETLVVFNHSETEANLTFAIDGDKVFSLAQNNCAQLASQQSCELRVQYKPLFSGNYHAYLTVTADDPNVATSRTTLSGAALGTANILDGVAGPSNGALNWFSGGDKPWITNAISGVQSGAIGNLQDSILMAVTQGKGELSFEWSVSSEENIDDPSDPFDALYLRINGEQIYFISGEQEGLYTSELYYLGDGQNIITWVYNKDADTTAGEDAGFVRNVIFKPEVVSLPVPIGSGGSGGGSLGWLSLILLGLGFIRRK
jgi:secreted trypsin-like serine protease